MPTQSRYRRVVVRLGEGRAAAPAVRLAAELAQLLDLALEGIFVEDEALLALAGLPFARELRLPGHTWQALDAGRVLDDFRGAASRAERLLAEAAARLGIASGFSVLRGDPATLAGQYLPSDILVISPTAIVHGQFPPSADPAWPARSAIMLAPAGVVQKAGAIAAAPSGRESVTLQIAAAIARRAGEDLLLIMPGSTQQADEAESVLHEAGLSAAHIRRRHVHAREARAIITAARASRARLLVLDRVGFPDAAARLLARLAAEAGLPVLLVGEAAEISG